MRYANKKVISLLVFFAALGLSLAFGCKTQSGAGPVSTPIDLTKVGKYTMTVICGRGANYVVSYIVVQDGKESSRSGGYKIDNTDIKLVLRASDHMGNSIYQKEFDNRSLDYGQGYAPPHTTLIFDLEGDKFCRGGREKFLATLEIKNPTSFYGNDPVKWVVGFAGK